MIYNVVQWVLVAMIVAAAALAAVLAVVRAMNDRKTSLTACAGCKLQDICTKAEKNSVKKCADKVAQVKKSQ